MSIDKRFWEITKRDLASIEFGEVGVPNALADTWAAVGLFEAVLHGLDTRGQSRAQLHHNFVKLLEGYLTVILSGGAEGSEKVEDALRGWHRPGDLVEQREERVRGVLRSGHGQSYFRGGAPASLKPGLPGMTQSDW
jgi:hypothetical protein